MKELPTIKIEGKPYYIDKKLSQIREVSNPHNWEPVSQEIIYYWFKHNIKQL